MLNVKKGRAVSQGTKGFKLTPKMRSFIDLYLIHMNATKAVELSGYKTKNPSLIATHLMQHPLVIAEIERRLSLRSEKAEVKAEFLIQKLLNIIDATEVDNPQAALRAIELAGKSIALWRERQEISGPDGEAIRHEQHVKESAAELTSKIAALSKRSGTDGDNVVPFIRESFGTGTEP